MDIILSFLGLIILSPIFLITAIAIRLESKGKVIFSQTRTGKDGKEFKMYKFRSMCEDAEKLRSSRQRKKRNQKKILMVTLKKKE